jgi:hypothetical protein
MPDINEHSEKSIGILQGQGASTRYEPALIFVLISFVCILTGWQIGISGGSSSRIVEDGIRGVLLGLILGSFLSFSSFGLATGWIWQQRYPDLGFKHFLILTLGWMVIPISMFLFLFYDFSGDITESSVGIVLICITSLGLVLVGLFGGFIGGFISSRVLRALNPGISRELRAQIVRRSTLGFFVGFLFGGTLMGIGFASVAVNPSDGSSYQWAFFVAMGFALMGAIGTTMAGTALFGKE